MFYHFTFGTGGLLFLLWGRYGPLSHSKCAIAHLATARPQRAVSHGVLRASEQPKLEEGNWSHTIPWRLGVTNENESLMENDEQLIEKTY